jgi:8-oxo-dGTP pyrophosphatase MutT (NUDIX family)
MPDRITLSGCIMLHNNSILLLHRTKKNCYELPGGKVKDNESPKNAAKREIKEELGCDVTIMRKIGNKEFTENGRNMTYIWFLASIHKGQSPKVMETNIFDHYKYIPIDKLETYKLSTNMQNLAKGINTGNITIG